MTIKEFQKKLKPGMRVTNRANSKVGVVSRISKDNDKALVDYENGIRAWDEYYLLEFITQNT